MLTSAPRFDQPVIGATGRMAPMRTVAPAAFVEFKRWMAKAAPKRERAKRRRDARPTQIVQSLIDEGLLGAPH